MGTNPGRAGVWRSARYIEFIRSFKWFDWVPMLRGASASGVLVLVTRLFDAVLWRACSRVRASLDFFVENVVCWDL